MKEVFTVKKWNIAWKSWYYLSNSTNTFNGTPQIAKYFTTYAEAHYQIEESGKGTYGIDKLFIQE